MPTSIEVDVILEDVVHYYEYQLLKSPATRKRRWLVRFGLPLLWLVAMVQMSNEPIIQTVILNLILIAAWVYLYPPMARMLLRRNIQKAYIEGSYKQALGRHSYSFSSDHLFEKGSFGESSVRWDYVHKIDKTSNLAFFTTGLLRASIIPRRCFTTNEAFNAFTDEAVKLRTRFITSKGEDTGGDDQNKTEMESVKKYRSYVLTRLVVALIVIVAGGFTLIAYWNVIFHTPQSDDQERALPSMQEAARLDLGMQFTISSGVTKEIGGPLLWRVIIAFDSDSVAAFQDTLGVEREILVIIGGLARYSPSEFDFIYKQRVSSFQAEEIIHTYQTDEVRGFLGMAKGGNNATRDLSPIGASGKNGK